MMSVTKKYLQKLLKKQVFNEFSLKSSQPSDLKSAQMTNDPKSAFDSNSRMPKLAISNRLPYFLSLQSPTCLKVHKFDQNLDQILGFQIFIDIQDDVSSETRRAFF